MLRKKRLVSFVVCFIMFNISAYAAEYKATLIGTESFSGIHWMVKDAE